MNDLFGKALIALPAFVSHVLELLSGPKAFILGKDMETAESALEAYTFLGITLFIALIAQVTFLPEQKDYLLTFASIAVQGALNLILMVAALFFAWRIVGGTLSFKIFFIVSCYFSGISTLILAYFSLLASGWLKIKDPDNAIQLLHGSPVADPSNIGVLGFLLIFCAGLIAVYVWILVVWGAYRQLNNVSRRRSTIALIVFSVLIPLLMVPQYYMQGNFLSAQERRGTATGSLPLELVGLWGSVYAAGSGGAPSTEALSYNFASGGEYFRLRTNIFKQGACTTTTQENSFGRASVDGSMLTLAPIRHTKTVNSTCSDEKSETPLDPAKEIYPFEIRHESTGWMLCLAGRYGKQCFMAAKPPSP